MDHAPFVLNILLIAILVSLLMARRRSRWTGLAEQGLPGGGIAVPAGMRVARGAPDDFGPWEQGTLTREPSGSYLWTPGGRVTPQRLEPLRVQSTRTAGWFEAIWSLQRGWVVLTCDGVPGREIGLARASARVLPELTLYAGPQQP